MKTKKFRVLILMVLFALGVLSACQAEPTEDPAMVITNVALTVQSDLTQTAIAMPTNTPTTPPTATNTQVPPTATMAVTTTAISSVATTAAPLVGARDAGVWVSSDPADGTKVATGEVFSVKVTLMNTGQTTWTPQYYIKFISGDDMGEDEKVYFPFDVPPTRIVDIMFDFTAPDTGGLVRGDWSIHNSADQSFYPFYFEYEAVVQED